MTVYYAETAGLSCDVLIHREGVTIDCITADAVSLDAKDDALSRSGYRRSGYWIYIMKLPTSRFLAAIEKI